MAKWIARSVVAAPRNGTASHTVSFTPATAGSLLVAVIDGAVTSTTPAGWTLPAGGAAVNFTGLYVWTKTATAGESSFTTAHNGSNYPVAVMVYEFAAGSTFIGSAASTGDSAVSLPGLTGTNLLMGASAENVSTTASPVWTWTAPAGIVKDSDQTVPFSGTDGYSLSVAYVEDSTATTWAPTSTVAPATVSAERLAFAIKAAAAPSGGAFSGSAALAGSGSLTTSRVVAFAAAVALTGAGVLSAVGTPGVAAPAGAVLSGSGSISAVGVPASAATAPLSGSGSLSGAPTVAGAGAATLTGSGALSAVGRPAHSGTAYLSGSGDLRGSGVASQAGEATAALSGAGSLSATGTPGAAAAAALAGGGSLAANATPRATSPANLAGAGALVARPVPSFFGQASLSGSGNLSGATPRGGSSVQWTGAGERTLVCEGVWDGAAVVPISDAELERRLRGLAGGRH